MEKSPKGRVASTQVSSGRATVNGGSITSKQIGISISFNSMSMIDIQDGVVSFDLQVNGASAKIKTESALNEGFYGYQLLGGLHTYIDASCMNQDCEDLILSIMTYNESGSEGKQLAVLVKTRNGLNELIQDQFEASTAVPGSMLNLNDLVYAFFPMP